MTYPEFEARWRPAGAELGLPAEKRRKAGKVEPLITTLAALSLIRQTPDGAYVA